MNETFNLILNIAIFSLIPLIGYLFSRKTIKGFFRYLGIFKPQGIDIFQIIIIIVTTYLITLIANIIVIYSGNSMRANTIFQNTTFSIRFLYILLYGLKTGIAEEIFFRGFIAKRCFSKLGFNRGNVVQAIIFALPHFVIDGSASYIDIIVRIINAFILGYMFGYVVDRKSNGSIIPVMLAHILINMTSSFILSSIL